MTVLFDSSAWLEYFFGSEAGLVVKQLVEESKESIVATKINIFEVYHKILKERGREEAERFTSFVLLQSLLDDLDVETLKLAAEEKKKLGLGMADAIILATAIKYGAIVYTKDNDFKKAKDLVHVVFIE